MNPQRARVLQWLRPIGGVAILGVVVWRVGTGPFVSGVRAVTIWPVVAGAAIAVVSTVCSAWRWQVVARGLGVSMTMRSAVAACYRAQFVNTVLPGGVLGDVDRAVRQGRSVNDVGLGLRAVVWERFVGQFVQLALTFVVLLAFPIPVPSALLVVAAILVAALFIGFALHLHGTRLRLGSVRAWVELGIASTVAVASYVCILLIAARTAGSTTPLAHLVPLVMIVLLASALPTSIGGWGPREGVAAWLFAAAGFGASQGIAIATVYGVIVFASCLPGGVLLAAALVRRRRAAHPPSVLRVVGEAQRPIESGSRNELRVSV